MKKLFLGILVCLSVSAKAQLRLPQPSSAASVSQTVGTTDFTVKYSRPNVRGREIFGSLIAYDKVWRTGANAATQISFSNDITLGGQKVAAGTYSVFSIPTKEDWTLILNKDVTASEQSYSKEKDVLRTSVKALTIPKTESFSIDFSDITDTSANLNIYWADKKVSAPIFIETAKIAENAITKAVNDHANTMRAAAEFYLSKGKFEQALTAINTSITGGENVRNVWVKAQVLSKLGNYTEAFPLAQKALALLNADATNSFGFLKDAIEKGVAEYKTKLPVAAPYTPAKKKKASL